MRSDLRGLALPETAVVLSVVLLVLFGIIQLAFWGYAQTSVQGAAFVAAHAAALNGAGQSADQTYARSVIAGPFPNINSSELILSEPPGSVTVNIVKQLAGGMPMVNLPSSIRVQGVAIEAIPGGTVTGTAPSGSQFAVQATLTNYCDGVNTCVLPSNHPLYIAQFDPLGTKANGKNGQFGEWKCRPNYYPSSWPSTLPAPGPAGSNPYAPGDAGFAQGVPGANKQGVYSFDSQQSQWGQSSSC